MEPATLPAEAIGPRERLARLQRHAADAVVSAVTTRMLMALEQPLMPDDPLVLPQLDDAPCPLVLPRLAESPHVV